MWTVASKLARELAQPLLSPQRITISSTYHCAVKMYTEGICNPQLVDRNPSAFITKQEEIGENEQPYDCNLFHQHVEIQPEEEVLLHVNFYVYVEQLYIATQWIGALRCFSEIAERNVYLTIILYKHKNVFSIIFQ